MTADDITARRELGAAVVGQVIDRLYVTKILDTWVIMFKGRPPFVAFTLGLCWRFGSWREAADAAFAWPRWALMPATALFGIENPTRGFRRPPGEQYVPPIMRR